MTDSLTISLIMPCYNARAYIDRALSPLIGLMAASEVEEVIVVDDASSDRTAEQAEAHGVRVLRSGTNEGPAAARNRGAAVAKSDILWFVDSDVVVHPDGAALIRAAFDDVNVVAVFGSYDDTPSAPDWLSRYKNLVHRYQHQRAGPFVSTFWSGCGAVRAETFARSGGFDQATYTHPSIEDIELGYRLSRLGLIRVLPHLQGKHLKEWHLFDLISVDITRRAIPWSKLILEREGLSDTLNTSVAERLRAAVALTFGPALAMGVLADDAAVVMLLPAVLALVANWQLFQYLRRHGGVGFALAGLTYHQLYYAYSSAVFVGMLLKTRLERRGLK